MGSNDEQKTDGEPLRLLSVEELLARDPLADDPLRDFFVWWNTIARTDADELERVLDGARRTPRKAEAVLQKYLEEHPLFLSPASRWRPRSVGHTSPEVREPAHPGLRHRRATL